MEHKFNPDILREYDIRGEVNKTIFDQDAKVLGHLIANKLKKNKKVNVCYDGRHSSVNLKNALIKGLNESGANVVEIGLGPTPLLYYSCFVNEAEAGIMVTGSHNPPSHNGFKIVIDNQPFFGDQIRMLEKDSQKYSLKKKSNTLQMLDVKTDYLNKLSNSIEQKNR